MAWKDVDSCYASSVSYTMVRIRIINNSKESVRSNNM